MNIDTFKLCELNIETNKTNRNRNICGTGLQSLNKHLKNLEKNVEHIELKSGLISLIKFPPERFPFNPNS